MSEQDKLKRIAEVSTTVVMKGLDESILESINILQDNEEVPRNLVPMAVVKALAGMIGAWSVIAEQNGWSKEDINTVLKVTVAKSRAEAKGTIAEVEQDTALQYLSIFKPEQGLA